MISAAIWALMAVGWFFIWRFEVRENGRLRRHNELMTRYATWYVPRPARATKVTFFAACAYLGVAIMYFVGDVLK